MAVPKKKTSPSRRGMRRSHLALKKNPYATNKNGDLHRSHHIDEYGMYNGKQVLIMKQV